MIYVKVDVSIPTHPKFVKAGVAAVGFWTAALAYSASHLLDGLVPDESIGIILGLGPKEARKLCKRLVEVGLFERIDSGYLILKYSEKNNTKAQIEAKREVTKARVDKFRNAKRNGVTPGVTDGVTRAVGNADRNGAVPGSAFCVLNSDLSEGMQGETAGKPPDPPEMPSEVRVRAVPVNATADGAFGMSVEAWCEGIALATGVPCSRPSVGAVRTLVGAINEHVPVGADVVVWAKGTAKQYAEANAGRTLSPFGFCDWLTSGKPSRAAQSAPGTSNGIRNDSPAGREERKRRDADYARDWAEAVPAPLGELLAAVGAKPAAKPLANVRAPSPPAPESRPEIRRELTDDERALRRQEQLDAAQRFGAQ